MKSLDSSQNYPSEDRGMDEVCYPHINRIVMFCFWNCLFLHSFEISAFLQALAMIHSIEVINNSTLLSGVKLGYEIYDTCTEVTAAVAATLRFLSKFNCSRETVTFQCDYSSYLPRVKAVIGAGYSEISMAVSRILNLQLMPQVHFCSPSFHMVALITFVLIKRSGKPRN